MKILKKNEQRGAALVTILVFSATALVVTTAAITMSLLTTVGTSEYSIGENALFVAESGIEEGILRVIRDRDYTGSTLNIVDETATISVSGTSPVIILSTGTSGNFTRKVEVQGNFVNGVFEITSWNQID